MLPDDVYRLLKQQPFHPFRLHLSNGRSFDVRHPELAMVGVSAVLIGAPAAGLSKPVFADYDVVALAHINNVEFLASPTPPTTNGPA
jgi:hypothetical protein